MSDLVHTGVAEGVCTILLNRPEKKNALTLSMYQAMADAISDAVARQDVRVIVLGSEGPNFTAGNDLADFLKNPSMDEDGPICRFLFAWRDCPLPLVVAVQGFAIGIGSTLLLHADQVIADESAVFSFPFVNLGLVPEAGSSLLLPKLVGYQRAANWLLTGDPVPASKAYAAGLVGQLVGQGEALATAMAYAKKLAAKPRDTLIRTRQLLRRDEEPLSARMELELQWFAQALNSAPAKEAMSAFLEKRKPDFRNL